MRNQSLYLSSLCLSVACITACDPVCLVMGSGVAIGTAATREKGVGGAARDTVLSTQVKNAIYAMGGDIASYVSVNVQNGDVLIVGYVPTEELVCRLGRVVSSVSGVRTVWNCAQKSSELSMRTSAADGLVTAYIKSDLLCDSRISSLNYSIKTYDSVVYVMGIAQNEAELDRVLEYGRHIQGVKKVVSFVKIKDESVLKGEP